jgi:hypothetical protein
MPRAPTAERADGGDRLEEPAASALSGSTLSGPSDLAEATQRWVRGESRLAGCL